MKTILVIEDNLAARENLCEILELAGYRAVPAIDGMEGVRLAKEISPDLIICDILMPNLDGYGVLSILNKNSITFDIPFIFLTAKVEMTDVRKGMGLGADDYITKPFDHKELLETLELRLAKSARIRDALDHSDSGLRRFFSEAEATKEIKKLAENREIVEFKKKEPIYQQGRTARWLYYVVSGKVKSYYINELGKELISHIYTAGDFFGYNALLEDRVHFDNTEALNKTVVHLVPKGDFMLAVFNNRDFAAQFIRILSHHAQDMEQQLIEMAYSSVRRKVANALVAYINTNAKTAKSSLEFTTARDTLASMAGTAKETLIRTLSDFKSEGIIQIDGSSIKILDLDRLVFMPQ